MTEGGRVVPLTDGAVDLGREVVRRHGKVTPLTTREAALFAYLASRPGQAVSRDELHTRVWGYAAAVVSRTVDTTIRRLRAKIEVDPSQPAHLQTVHGEGYRFQPVDGLVGDRIGRGAELAAIVHAVGVHPRVGVVGGAGVGKTRLVRDVVEVLIGAGKPVVGIDVAGIGDPVRLALAVAGALGLSLDGDDPVARVGGV
ncbi:MAG: winged helix-turn-helix domain-containing protein, partial [Myxococcota bacterium]